MWPQFLMVDCRNCQVHVRVGGGAIHRHAHLCAELQIRPVAVQTDHSCGQLREQHQRLPSAAAKVLGRLREFYAHHARRSPPAARRILAQLPATLPDRGGVVEYRHCQRHGDACCGGHVVRCLWQQTCDSTATVLARTGSDLCARSRYKAAIEGTQESVPRWVDRCDVVPCGDDICDGK